MVAVGQTTMPVVSADAHLSAVVLHYRPPDERDGRAINLSTTIIAVLSQLIEQEVLDTVGDQERRAKCPKGSKGNTH